MEIFSIMASMTPKYPKGLEKRVVILVNDKRDFYMAAFATIYYNDMILNAEWKHQKFPSSVHWSYLILEPNLLLAIKGDTAEKALNTMGEFITYFREQAKKMNLDEKVGINTQESKMNLDKPVNINNQDLTLNSQENKLKHL